MLTTLLTSVAIPVLVDFIKTAAPSFSRKIFGLSVDDEIKLESAQIQRLTALAQLDNPYGVPSQWVVDLRGSFRYVAAASLILGGLGLAAYGAVQTDPEAIAVGIEMASAPFGFIFGERLVLSYKAGGK